MEKKIFIFKKKPHTHTNQTNTHTERDRRYTQIEKRCKRQRSAIEHYEIKIKQAKTHIKRDDGQKKSSELDDILGQKMVFFLVALKMNVCMIILLVFRCK